MSTHTLARVTALFGVLALAGCGESSQQSATGSAPQAVQVTVAKPIRKMTVDMDEYVGRFVAVDSVEIRARVSGYLDKVHFQDGQIVQQGDLLFTIDRRPLENALAQARANLAQARSNQTFAENDLARGQQLVTAKTITEQTFDQRSMAKRNAEASVAANEAAVRQAELDLQFSELRAPVTGRIGDRRVSPGNLVVGNTTGSGTTLLATIVSLDPIRFEFTFDEASFLRYQRLAKGNADKIANFTDATVVKLKLLDEPNFAHDGKMDFVDNVIDRATGTIRGRAVLANPNGLFLPGMFARIQVPGSPPYEALHVPDAVIGTEQARKFVYVVDAENTARQKYVTLGTVADGLRVIKDGLDPNDRVVVNGLMRVRPGVKVTPVEEGVPPNPAPQAKS
jgi:multidrug efflux system membrane fusion protein